MCKGWIGYLSSSKLTFTSNLQKRIFSLFKVNSSKQKVKRIKVALWAIRRKLMLHKPVITFSIFGGILCISLSKSKQDMSFQLLNNFKPFLFPGYNWFPFLLTFPMLANHLKKSWRERNFHDWQHPKKTLTLPVYVNAVTDMYMHWREMFACWLLMPQVKMSSCQATYQKADFIVKDAELSTSYTKSGNKIMFYQ